MIESLMRFVLHCTSVLHSVRSDRYMYTEDVTMLEDSLNVGELGNVEPLRERQSTSRDVSRRKSNILLQLEFMPKRAKLELPTHMKEFKALIRGVFWRARELHYHHRLRHKILLIPCADDTLLKSS